MCSLRRVELRKAGVRLAPTPPAAAQLAWAQANGLVERLGLDHAVGAEVAEALTQLAPCDQQAARLGIAEDHRPHRSLGFLASLGSISEPQLPAIADR